MGDNVSSDAGPNEVVGPNEGQMSRHVGCGFLSGFHRGKCGLHLASLTAGASACSLWLGLEGGSSHLTLALPLLGYLHLHEGCLPQHVWEG